eukprot:27182-Pelagococcus_subviridis.AAC.3
MLTRVFFDAHLRHESRHGEVAVADVRLEESQHPVGFDHLAHGAEADDVAEDHGHVLVLSGFHARAASLTEGALPPERIRRGAVAVAAAPPGDAGLAVQDRRPPARLLNLILRTHVLPRGVCARVVRRALKEHVEVAVAQRDRIFARRSQRLRGLNRA